MFVWQLVSDSLRSSGDKVLDFSQSQGDQLDLSAFDATYVGEGRLLGDGEASVGWRLSRDGASVGVLMDADGDGQAEFAFVVGGTNSLSASDFILS